MGKSLVIRGADFSANSLPSQIMVNALVVGNLNMKATMRVASVSATVLMHKQGLNNTKWGVDSPDYSDKSNCALNAIPLGAKKVKATDTAKAKEISMCLFDENYMGLFLPSWSGPGNYSQEINIENYPTAKYFSLNYEQRPADIDTLTIEFSY